MITKTKTGDLLAIPVALAGGFLFASISGIPSVISWLCRMIFHEFGHAIIFWLNSQVAIPSFGVTATLQQTGSWFTFICFLALLCWAIRIGRIKNYTVLFFGGIGFAILLCLVSVFFSRRVVDELSLYAGLGGEIYLGVMAMLLFYARLPERFRWHINRYVFLVIGAISYASAGSLWIGIRAHREELPMGSLFEFGGAFSTEGGSDGDLDRLMREMGWSSDLIVNVYFRTFWVSTVVLVAVWGVVAYRRMRDCRGTRNTFSMG